MRRRRNDVALAGALGGRPRLEPPRSRASRSLLPPPLLLPLPAARPRVSGVALRRGTARGAGMRAGLADAARRAEQAARRAAEAGRRGAE